MADNRFNQMSGFAGNGYNQIGQQSHAMNGVPGIAPYMPAGMTMNPMMQQQMLMNPGMRFPMQAMHMGPPNAQPPPYNSHVASNIPSTNSQQPRASLSKSKANGPQTEKERFIEEQRRKLKQFGKPGATKVDEVKLIGSMFAGETKPKTAKASMHPSEDDGFGDFLQGPSSEIKKEEEKVTHHSVEVLALGPDPKHLEEKKDLKSIMLEYSDLSAPKKAKGFHKPTLNEVQKSGHDHQKGKVSSFHESDHARRWKGQAEDLDGLFQLPVVMKPKPEAPPSQVAHQAYTAPFSPVTPYAAVNLPMGPPPSYSEVSGHPTSPVGQSFQVTLGGHMPVVSHSSEKMSLTLPDWCTFNEEQMPPVYKQVWEASLINNKISTERLYPILLMSGLPREKLAEIWSLCNTATPGQLVKHELWLLLALIALTQHNYNTSTLDYLVRCPVAPIPQLNPSQDTGNTPATLLTTPSHHHIHAPHAAHLPANSTGAVHSTVGQGAGVSTHHTVVPQPHLVQYPVLQGTGRTVGLATSAAPTTAAMEDDFADFQAAAPNVNLGTKADEGFGEFIGGGGGNSGFCLPAPVSPPGDGFAGASQPQLTPKPMSLSLASLPVDDKYGTNVRSFFCSSDSSTGQTSPSFEDDDFTDGRDSLSQVSTSEQSENEDLRNFESYVEEFHQKKERPDGSPLHCPFPSVMQNQTPKVAQAFPRPAGKGLPGAVSDRRIQKNANVHSHAASAPSFSAFNHTPAPFSLSASVIAPPQKLDIGEGHEDDFSDFKSASILPAGPIPALERQEVGSLIGDEDKYGALRVFTLENDFSKKSVFEQPASGLKAAAQDEEEWADFSAAIPANDGATSLSTTAPDSASKKENILQLFNSTPVSKPAAFTGIFGGSSSGNSEGGSKNGSLFGDDHSATSTPSRDRIMASQLSLDQQLSSRSVSEQDVTLVTKSWALSEEPADDWTSFGGSSNPNASLSQSLTYAASPNDSRVNKLSASGSAINMLVSATKSDVSLSGDSCDFGKISGDGWDSRSRSISATSSNASLASTGIQGWKQETLAAIPPSGEDDEWSNFSSAIGSSASGIEESKFVTIKKQNLGTNEIMGLFKVRDDPATLSSYQLPQQKSTSKTSTKKPLQKHVSATPAVPSPSDGPPPLDFSHDDDEDEHAYSRGYDFDDAIHRGPPVTAYSPYGMNQAGPVYGMAGSSKKFKDNNRDDTGSVHSLDLRSTKPEDAYGSDSVSLSSADYNSGEMMGGHGAGGAVSAESRSLESLDLRNDSEIGHSFKEDVPAQVHHHPIQPQELLDSMPDFADKYNIEHEAQGSDRYGHEWERCLSNCYRVIMEANTLFNTISSSSVCNEVLKSSQGSEYVTSVIEIYRVVCRVMTSMRSTAISTTDLEQTIKDIDLAWNNLAAFLVGASLLPDQSTLVFTNFVLKSDLENAKQQACGICLLSVDITAPLASGSNGINTCKLTYAGRPYHATCANFWVNCVDQTLPYLTLPELL